MMEFDSIVRRLTTTETSRLMGFPDDYLRVKGAETPDSPMYKACGNSWGVNCARWVNLRIEKVLRETGIVGNDRPIQYATTCSGVEAHTLSVAGRPWNANFYSEIEPFPCEVLKARYPQVPNLGDMTKVDGRRYRLDVFSGGTPCQSFSVAGKRHGLGGSTDWTDTTTRSSLCFHWVRIGLETGAPILLFENVPGVYSSSEGRDFPWLLHFLNDHGYSVAWRTLDVQYCWTDLSPLAIPQRRRRCWLVAFRGKDWRILVRMLWERTGPLGSLHPDRVVNGETMPRKDVTVDAFDLFGGALTKPEFNASSRADMIPFKWMPKPGCNPTDILSFSQTCGKVGYCGPIFKGGKDPEHIADALRENIGNAGLAFDDFILTMKTPEWTGGIQLPDGAECPSAFNGTVCGLSDVLEPFETEADFDRLVKYFLSSRACSGILRRAEARGKDLPEELERALHEQIANWANGCFGEDANEDSGDIADGDSADDGEGENDDDPQEEE